MDLVTMSTFSEEPETQDNSSTVDPTLIFGPQRDSLYIVLPITIIYALIFITGLFGNIFTCIVIIRNKSMHTATNYYLFSLAVSDLLLLVSGMPQEMYSIWCKWPYVFGHTFCVIRGLAAETSTNASVLTITLFTIERYLAICHPFVSHKMSKLSRAVKHVMLLWVASLALALPQALQFGIKVNKGVEMCLQTRVIIEHSFEISTFFFFFAPMVLITVLYSLIGLRLNQTSVNKKSNEKDYFEEPMRFTHKLRRRHSQSTRRVVKMLVAVVVAFFVCWAPFHAQRLVAIYGTAENHQAKSPVLLFVYSILTYISGVFYYISTCINPIFYHIMSNKFRDAFKNTMVHWCCRRQAERRTLQRCSYSAIALSRHPHISGTINSGNCCKTYVPRHMKVSRMNSNGDKVNAINLHQWQSCAICSKGRTLERRHTTTSRLHRCTTCTQLTIDNTVKPNSDSDYQNLGRTDSNNTATVEISSIKETKGIVTCCCGQESPVETLNPPTPKATSSDDNRTEFYPVMQSVQPEKCCGDIGMKNICHEKYCR